ncbi:MAG: inositol monophosphatase family protein [Eubacteriales bacterium]|nr:inositol monophosphatase family protein [Eubacteriales bacterium]
MNEEIRKIYDAIISAELEAAELIIHASGIMTEEKTCHRDVVTEYDRRVQELVVARLRESVPGACFFCEENALHDDLHAEHLFVIDPIDGTMNFVKGYNHSSISVAYVRCGVLTAGAVYNPYLKEMFSAVKGEGAWLNGRPIRAAETPLSENIFSLGTTPYEPETYDETFRLARIALEGSLDLRRGASAALDLAYVAAGRVGLFFEMALSYWDYAAGCLIVQEAGGICSTVDGTPLPMDGSRPSVLAGGKQAYADFRAKL